MAVSDMMMESLHKLNDALTGTLEEKSCASVLEFNKIEDE